MRPGETLYAISWRYGQDYRDLAAWNRISAPYLLIPGQYIRMTPGPEVAHSVPDPALVISPPSVASASVPGLSKPVSDTKRPVRAPQKGRRHGLSWQWPAHGKVIHAYHKGSHGVAGRGLDISGHAGDVVVSTAAGRVVYSGSGMPSYGKLLIIKHNENYLSAYAHNQSLLVKEGAKVRAGQPIAEMGSSGSATTRVVLHFEIRRRGHPVDPGRLLPAR